LQPISKGFFLGSILGSFGLGILLAFASLARNVWGDRSQAPSALMFTCAAFIPMIFGVVVLMMLVYKMWDVIQDGKPRTTPGMAVGLMFVPIFGLYWQFQVYWGWTKDFNAYVEQQGIAAPRMPEGLALTLCILTLAAIVPLVGLIIALVNLILMVVFLSKACDGINAIVKSRQGA
jgi:hypothetical protein